MLINEKNGDTKYYEYGRYDPNGNGIVGTRLPQEEGNVRKVAVPNAKIGQDGKPTEESLKKYTILCQRALAMAPQLAQPIMKAKIQKK
ncbi:MAG: hypothetical protein IPJ99_01440 [Betaproteobacteria bacterium]|nr:hypothetical protein [Betaproteobacteria bacterium]